MSKLIQCACVALAFLSAGAADHPYGGIRLTGTFDVDGLGRVTDTTIWAESYPTQYHIKAVLQSEQYLYSYTVSDDAQKLRFPEMDEALWIMPPKVADAVMDVGVELATAQLYVAPNGTDADGFGSSPQTPYRTLAYAVSKASNKAADRTVIHAAAGDYTEGAAAAGEQTAARVLIDRSVRLKGAGRGRSVIWGEKDTTSGSADKYGCGPDAVRCVQFSVFDKTCVQGFTLRDGRSGTDTNERMKGGVVCKGVANMICDCLVTNCFGYNGTASYFGSFIRSVITCNDNENDNKQSAFSANGIASCRLICCIARHRSVGGSSSVLGPVSAYQSTLVGDRFDPAKDGAYAVKVQSFARNCAIGQGNRTLTAGGEETITDNLLWDAAGGVSSTYFSSNLRFGSATDHSSPYLYGVEADDDRPATASPLIGAGTLYDDYYKTYSSDVNGNPIAFVDGRPTLGAVQTFVKTLVVPKYAGRDATLTVTGAASLTNAVDTGDTVTLTLSDMTRPGGSFVVNGETVQGPSHTFVVDDKTPDQLLITNVTFTSDWYVDDVDGDDANGGFYPGKGFAKQTLAGMLTNKLVKANDTVHAAAGTYDRGFSGSTRTRAAVGDGVTLVADEGPEKTVILGQAAETDPDDEGCGVDAVRCASTGKNSRLSGFTLTGGRVPANVSGGAASQTPTAILENCIITNNAGAYKAAAVQGGILVNCRIFGNRSSDGSSGSVVNQSYGAYGCVVDKNTAKYVFQGLDVMYGCTVGSNNLNLARTTALSLYYPSAGNVFANSIVMGDYNTTSGREFNASNSVFALCSYSRSTPSKVNLYGNSCYTNAADIVLAGNYAPASKDSFLVDTGDAAHVDDAKFRGKDALGGQRVYNGSVDIGAVEYDWRGDYAADLVRKGDCTVTAATANVIAQGTSVKVPADGSLTLRWKLASGASRGHLAVTVDVVGTGSLEVYLNGALVETRTAASKPTFDLKTRTADNEVVFKYVGTDGYALFDNVADLVYGLMLLVR